MADPIQTLATDLLAGRPPVWEGIHPGRAARLLVGRGLAGLAVVESRRAEEDGAAPMPPAAWELLEPVYASWGLHSTLAVESARRAREVLADADVESIAFKGVALLETGVYGDPGARLMEDADLLVRPSDVPAAVDALVAAGFEPWEPWREGRQRWLASMTMADGSSPAGVDVDLHWATPYASLRIDDPVAVDPLWEGADLSLGAPALEPHFVLLAGHFLKHLRVVTHLRGLADLARLAPALADGRLLRRHAEMRGIVPGVRAILALLRDRLDVALPEAVAAEVGVPPLRGLAAMRLDPARLLADRPGDRGRLGALLADGPLALGWRGALREALRVVLPPDRWLRARYEGEGGRVGRRIRYLLALWRWAGGRGASPLAPNQKVVRGRDGAWHGPDDDSAHHSGHGAREGAPDSARRGTREGARESVREVTGMGEADA